MKRALLISLAAAGALVGTSAQAEGLAVGAKASTLGIGAELVKSFTPTINGRVMAHTFSYDKTGTEDDVEYDIDFDWSSAAAMVDWFPWNGNFRATAGLVANGNEAKFTATSTTTFEFNGNVYDLSEAGDVHGTADFDSVAPYLGVGWGNSVGQDKKLSFGIDVGVLFQGSPDLEMTASGGALANDADFLADLEAHEREVEDDLSGFEYYPVISFGVNYQF